LSEGGEVGPVGDIDGGVVRRLGVWGRPRDIREPERDGVGEGKSYGPAGGAHPQWLCTRYRFGRARAAAAAAGPQPVAIQQR
jgi:hypothetical protein